MERLARGEFSPRELQEMRSASRSPNKRSVSDTRCCDEQEDKDGHQSQPRPQQHDALVLPASGNSGASGALTVPVPAPTTVTPFKRFRADSLISPSKGRVSGSTAVGGSGVHELFARRRALPTFQSLAKDHTTKPMTTAMQLKVRAAAESDRSTQDSSQHSTQTQNSQESTQPSSQGESAIVKAIECSPSDVAELCSQVLVCSETLEEQMDALDVGSFLSWRPTPPSAPHDDRTLLHRRKPRIGFDDEASFEIGLQEVFGDEAQLEDPLPLHFLPPPSYGAIVHFPHLEDHDDDDDEDSCCMCSGDHEHEHEDVERYWQVYSPPPHVGFDPKSCSPELGFESDEDTDNESPFDSL